jgi:hypothetical protein
MRVTLVLEASQPCGTRYRVGFGCYLAPALVSMITMLLARLF